MKPIELEIQGKKISGIVWKVKGQLWVHSNGETYCFDDVVAKKSSSKAKLKDPNLVAAPMPGKITQVGVQKGQDVKAEQTLIVMEAMKMEYALKAPRAAKIKNISCVVGDQVTLGKILVELE